MKKKSYNLINAAKYYVKHNDESITSIAKKFNVDRGSLSKTTKDYELYTIDGKNGFYYYFTDEELNMVDYYVNHPHENFSALREKFNSNISSGTVKRWMQVLGIEYQPHYKYSNNRNAFDQIRNEEDAYWLGFITADGYINETNNWLNIGLGEIDLEHLKKFLRYMQFTEEEISRVIKKGHGGAYTKDNVVYSVVISGKLLVDNLKQYGLFQGKSGKEIPYHFDDCRLNIAYIRGLIDGDGYIRSTQFGVGLAGSQEIVEYVRDFLGEQLHWTDYKEKYIHPHGKIYTFAVGGRLISQQILHLLYDNSHIYLDRKFELYKQYCRDKIAE